MVYFVVFVLDVGESLFSIYVLCKLLVGVVYICFDDNGFLWIDID